ncbi:MAG: TIR domain-containing protein [Clostridia bacterium]|nr:TIR domain-containing protein [Clostridia bacterium]
MAVYKCKMCGGDLNIAEKTNVAVCEYCGTTQTVPSVDNEKKTAMYNRANWLRLANEFDKAAGIYENIIAEFPQEAEAYWGVVLCTYGVEYVDDPTTGKKIPTCHRSSFFSVMENAAYVQACENADVVARRVYQDEAKRLEEIRKGILEISSKEEPYDIFICYKETDECGNRTTDSEIAQDVYDALTEKGYRVFFSRITLEDKLGQEYEPYIFAALNSAKVMLVFGTDYEYFNAVWVKNEWSRFLHLMSTGQKKVLIPCYKGIDAVSMPKEFSRLQAQDMGKVGAIQDLLRGIGKILGKPQGFSKESVVVKRRRIDSNSMQSSSKATTFSTSNIIKLGSFALNDKKWTIANEKFEEALKLDPENAEAHLGTFLARKQVKTLLEYFDRVINRVKEVKPQPVEITEQEFEELRRKIVEENVIPDFLDKASIERYLEIVPSTYSSILYPVKAFSKKRIEELHNDGDYMRAVKFASGQLKLNITKQESNYISQLQKLIDEAEEQDRQSREAAIEICRKKYSEATHEIELRHKQELNVLNNKYKTAKKKLDNAHVYSDLIQAKKMFESLKGFSDSKQCAQLARERAKAAYDDAFAKYNQKYPLLQKKKHINAQLIETRGKLDNPSKKQFQKKAILICWPILSVLIGIVLVVEMHRDQVYLEGVGDYIELLGTSIVLGIVLSLVGSVLIVFIRKLYLKAKEDMCEDQLNEIQSIPAFKVDEFRF